MNLETLRMILKRQYHVSLAMLRDAIEQCPEELWLDTREANSYWQIAYHALYYTHLYLHVDEQSATAWPGHRGNVQYPSALPNPFLAVDASQPKFAEPYTKAEVLEFLDLCNNRVDQAIESFDLTSGESGFWWYAMGKLEHQFVNIRHIQHHTAQLASRLRSSAGRGVAWVA